MQEQESKADGHGVETLGWIALAQGTGTASGRRILVKSIQANHSPVTASFSPVIFNRRFPAALCDLASSNGLDTAVAAQQNLTPFNVACFVQEEQSLDAELLHGLESLSVFVAE